MRHNTSRWIAGMLASALTVSSSVSFAKNKAERYVLDDRTLQQSLSAANISRAGMETSLLKDNVNAFEAKLEVIRNAKTTLDLQYYIYSDDESSSYFSRELIRAANRGVKVRILLDYITNYSKLDLLLALQNSVDKSKGGSIEVRLFNRPTANIIRDAVYISSSCSDALNVKGKETECGAEKQAKTDQLIPVGMAKEKAMNFNSGFSGILLSGMYGKSAKTLMFTLSAGAKLDLEALKSGGGGKMSEKDREDLINLFKLYRSAKNGNPLSMIKIMAAEMMYGEKVQLIVGNLDKILPLHMSGYDKNRGEDWDHITDFLHHKLLLGDSADMVLGGRNIENSYHMYKSPSGKYTFMDTDVRVRLNNQGGAQVKASFDRLFNFRDMVASLDEVMTHAPNDVQVALDSCQNADLRACAAGIPTTRDQVIAARTQRLQAAAQKMAKNAEEFERNLNVKAQVSLAQEMKIDTSAKIGYLENVPFNKNARNLVRTYGADANKEELGGKYIHKVMTRAMLDTCNSRKQQTIYLHQAYVIPSANLLSTLAEMTKTAEEDTDFSDGYQNLDCSNVTIKILTNSVETTDLSIINIFARAQMHELFKAVETARTSSRGKKAARLEYYEYRKAAQIESLHSKISIIGDRAIVGSANADVRSFMMDTNNGILVENAPQFVSSYSQFMESILKNNQLVERVDLGWRNWKAHEADGLQKEITILFDRIGKVLENRKWATKERLDRAKASFMKHMIGETREATKAMTTMFTNIEPELEKEIESNASDRLGDPLSRYLKKLKELRENKRSFDEAHKVL